MVKHSPNDRLRIFQQQRAMDTANGVTPAQLDTQAQVHADMPALETATGEVLPPVGEALRRAAEVRAEAEAQDATATGFTPHPNVNVRRRRGMDHADDIHLDDDFRGDDLGGSFMDDGFPDGPPPWLSQVINAAVTAAATAVAALPRSAPPRSSMAPTKLSDRKAQTSGSQSLRSGLGYLMHILPSSDLQRRSLLTLYYPSSLQRLCRR